jgi:hypothetical protein
MIILRYLKHSKQMMGQPYYDILSPKLPGYTYTNYGGYPTFSLETLKAKGLLKGEL